MVWIVSLLVADRQVFQDDTALSSLFITGGFAFVCIVTPVAILKAALMVMCEIMPGLCTASCPDHHMFAYCSNSVQVPASACRQTCEATQQGSFATPSKQATETLSQDKEMQQGLSPDSVLVSLPHLS